MGGKEPRSWGILCAMRPDAIRDAGLRELGANARLQKMAHDPDGNPRPYDERVKLFDEYKAELKKHHRQVALECHPDRTTELPEEERAAKTARFKRITRAVEFLMTISPRPPQPPRQMMRVIVIGGATAAQGSGWFSMSTNTTSSTVSSGIGFTPTGGWR